MSIKTFEPFIDESYDDNLPYEERYNNLISLLDTLCNLTANEIEILYIKLIPIINHNLMVFKKMYIPSFVRLGN